MIMRVLESTVEQLKTDNAVLPSTYKKVFWQCVESLNTCKSTCDDLRYQGITEKVWHAQSNMQRVEKLDTELSYAVQHLGLFLDCIINAKVEGIAEAVRKVNESVAQGFSDTNRKNDKRADRVECTTINPECGVYRGMSDGRSKVKPKAPGTPNVTVDEKREIMLIKWNYEECPTQRIDTYEVCLGSNLILHGTPQDLSNKDGYSYSIGASPPKIITGRKYTIQVRAISKEGGPSDWSKSAVCKFMTKPPKKPQNPIVTVHSPTVVTISVESPKEDDENGSPVQQWIVVQDDSDKFSFSM